MGNDDARVPCLWCKTDLNPKAVLCHGCGAVWARPPVSLLQVFFLYPTAAFGLMLAGLAFAGLPVILAAAVFVGSWFVLSVIYFAVGRPRRWIQVVPLLLDTEATEANQAAVRQHFGWRPWATGAAAATVAVGLALFWMGVPRSAATMTGSEPIPVAVTAAAPSSTALVLPLMQTASVAPAPDVVKPGVSRIESIKPEPPTADAAKADAVKVDAMKVDAAKAETAQPGAAPAPAAPIVPDKTLILQAQRLLDDLGYAPGATNGIVGSTTKAALRAFREHEKYAGQAIDADLVAALQTALTAKKELEARVEREASSRAPKMADISRPQQAEATPVMASSAAPDASVAKVPTSGADQAPIRLGAPVRLH